MKIWIKKYVLFFVGVLIIFSARTAAGEVRQFKDGDRICFIGDSITHNGLYHRNILLYYFLRYPDMNLKSWNCGINGENARGALARYDWDIAVHKPTIVTIMLGMNDVSRLLYGADKVNKSIKSKKASIKRNITNMDKLSERLVNDNIEIIYLTPSIYDQTGNQKAKNFLGVNDALKVCAEGHKKLAQKYKGGLVDFNGPMEKINLAQQEKNPKFTIVGKDRVHPGGVGNLVMTYLFLKEQKHSAFVALMDIDAAKSKVIKQDNCKISDLTSKDGVVSFSCLEKSLPFPVHSRYAKALDLVPLMKDLNQEVLKISGLSEGNYELLIDNQKIADIQSGKLAEGINLAEMTNTPQYKQALRVKQLVIKRYAIEKKLRVLAEVEKKFLRKQKQRSPENDIKMVQEELEKSKSRYYTSIYSKYLKYISKKTEMQNELDKCLEDIYKQNKPIQHKFVIRRLDK